ncbi:alkaline phosphatase-like isoform X2 [Cloeon dipterum]|uniref:alkaline phosphatase-like isoform X2 n=1 Tax=Cloeon dipterum TaxID=197152 RepID=UPI00322064A3
MACYFATGILILITKATAIEDAAFWNKVARQELVTGLHMRQNLQRAHNVVLFVGDGMGPNTITASRIYKEQHRTTGRNNPQETPESMFLRFERFPHVALLKTYNVDKQVPDSAGTATALFCGVKTNFKTVGVDANVKLGDCESSLDPAFHVHSILKWAQDAGKRTGFVTNTRVTHATPAALYAHCAHRSWECESKMPQGAEKCKDIARQLIEDEPGKSINVIMGGGRQCLTSNITITAYDPIDTWACQRKDGRDLINEWEIRKKSQEDSYKVVSTSKGLAEIDFSRTDYLLGVFANGFMKYDHEIDPEVTPTLAEMSAAAIQILQKGENGFVLVIEGGLIDQAHHRGTARRALDETVALDKAVEESLKMLHLSDTLVIVTADHTHSLSINGYPDRGSDILGIAQRSKADGLNFTTLTYASGTDIKYFPFNETHVTRTDPSKEDLTDFKYQHQATFLHDEANHGGGEVTVYAIANKRNTVAFAPATNQRRDWPDRDSSATVTTSGSVSV